MLVEAGQAGEPVPREPRAGGGDGFAREALGHSSLRPSDGKARRRKRRGGGEVAVGGGAPRAQEEEVGGSGGGRGREERGARGCGLGRRSLPRVLRCFFSFAWCAAPPRAARCGGRFSLAWYRALDAFVVTTYPFILYKLDKAKQKLCWGGGRAFGLGLLSSRTNLFGSCPPVTEQIVPSGEPRGRTFGRYRHPYVLYSTPLEIRMAPKQIHIHLGYVCRSMQIYIHLGFVFQTADLAVYLFITSRNFAL